MTQSTLCLCLCLCLAPTLAACDDDGGDERDHDVAELIALDATAQPDTTPDDAAADTGAPDVTDASDAPPDGPDASSDTAELTELDTTHDDGANPTDTLDASDAADTSDTTDISDSSDATGCDATCQSTTLAADFGGGPYPFDRAFYGLTAPEHTDSGQWELHVEVHHGGSTGCPDEASPTPDRTVILSGLVVPWPAAPVESGLGATLLDYQGSLLGDALFTRASAVTAQIVAGEVCVECVGAPAPAHAQGFVALELTATFDEGSAAGHVFATHCDNMDLAAPP